MTEKRTGFEWLAPPSAPWRDMDAYDYPHVSGERPVLFWWDGAVYTGVCRNDIPPVIDEDPLGLTWTDVSGRDFVGVRWWAPMPKPAGDE